MIYSYQEGNRIIELLRNVQHTEEMQEVRKMIVNEHPELVSYYNEIAQEFLSAIAHIKEITSSPTEKCLKTVTP